MLTALFILVCIGLFAVMSISLIGAIHANRGALPMCALMAIVILIFGFTW